MEACLQRCSRGDWEAGYQQRPLPRFLSVCVHGAACLTRCPSPPLCVLRQVSAPLFFMLGARDRRVPMDDAKQYINAVR